MDFTIIERFGVSAILCIPFFFLLKWLVAEVSKILERDAQERAKWLEVIQGFQSSITAHNEQAQHYHTKTAEEHRQMIECLGRINGYKHD